MALGCSASGASGGHGQQSRGAGPRPTVSAPSASASTSAEQQPPADVAPAPTAARECGSLTAEVGSVPLTEEGESQEPSPALALPLFAGKPRPQLDTLCEQLARRQQPADPDFYCFARRDAEDGAFAILSRQPNPSQPEKLWRLAYTSATTASARVVLGPEVAFSDVDVPAVSGGELPSIGQPVAITDFNRDRALEIITRTSSALDSNGTPKHEYQVWTLSQTRIEVYAPTSSLRIVQLRDSNLDGVPELILDPHGIQTGSPMGWSGASFDWTTLAVAEPDGSVSLVGPASKGYARELCPAPPDLRREVNFDNLSCFGWHAHCARLWGIPPASIKTVLFAACKGADPMSPCEYSMPGWVAIADWKPPFTLK